MTKKTDNKQNMPVLPNATIAGLPAEVLVPLAIKSLTVEPVQIPDATNNHTAVCSAELVTGEGTVLKDVGMASASEIPEGSNQTPLALASAKCKRAVLGTAVALSEALPMEKTVPEAEPQQPKEKPKIYDVPFHLAKPKPLPQSERNGGGTKPASEKQRGFITSLAQHSGTDPETLAQEVFGKPVKALQGSEADALIKKLKGTEED